MDWFLNLSVAEKIYFIIAIVASILLVIQIVIMLFSLGGGDFDMDDVFHGEGHDGVLCFGRLVRFCCADGVARKYLGAHSHRGSDGRGGALWRRICHARCCKTAMFRQYCQKNN